MENRGLAAALADRLVANPAATGGAVVMAMVAGAIITNAVALQSGQHPAPLFSGTRPVAAEQKAVVERSAVPTRTETPARDAIGDLLGAVPAVDPSLVRAIQGELHARGYYTGSIDGLTGPMTSDAILRFQQDHRLKQTGEPTSDVLAVLRATPQAAPEAPVASQAAPEEAAVQAPGAPTVIPLPRPSPLRGAAAAPAPDVRRVKVEPVRLAAVVETVGLKAAPAPQPTEDPKVARIQQSLDLLGYGPIVVDGRMNAETRAAIRRFEENRGLPVTGEINQTFLDEIVKIGGLAAD